MSKEHSEAVMPGSVNYTLGPLFPLMALRIVNFRGIKRGLCESLHPRLNVFHGRNGSGKSAVLDALRLGLAGLVEKLSPNVLEKVGELPVIQERDHHVQAGSDEAAFFVQIDLVGQSHRGVPMGWGEETNHIRGASVRWCGATEALVGYLDALNVGLRHSDSQAPLPVFVFYGAQRFFSSKAEQPPSDAPRIRADGLAGSLQDTASFEHAMDWFRREWIKELQERSERPSYESPSLRAVRQALATLKTPEGAGLQNPRIAKGTLQFVVDFVRPGMPELRLQIGQLSDGFRTLLLVVLDLMRRIIECYPLLPDEQDPVTRWRQTPAVVLIDEVDAHLHPSWQKTVLGTLLAAFPCAQFFVTTHAPLVLAAEQDATTWLLEEGRVSVSGHTYGKTPDVILEDYQGTSVRPSALQNLLDQASERLRQGDLDAAEALIAQLESQIEVERPELVGLRTELRFRRDSVARILDPGPRAPCS